jgi:FdrA protein
MVVRNLIRSGFYLDSVALMRTSSALKQQSGVDEAVLMIGTEPNKQILREAGVLDEAVAEHAGPSDLIIAVAAEDEAAAHSCIAAAEKALDDRQTTVDEHQQFQPRSLDSARKLLPDANLALISTPGPFAVREARGALTQGLNVMLFSDNISVEDECALKQLAAERGLILMGPDCGTAYVQGIPIAFANVVAKGHIGIVAASGTGLQEVAVQLSHADAGVSHGLGVGGRDLSDAVGGLSTLTALDWLEQDSETHQVVLISKPPGAATAAKIYARLRTYSKPVSVCFLGATDAPDGIRNAATLEGVAALATTGAANTHAVSHAARAEAHPGLVAGLFCGGTLCAEAQVIFAQAGRTWSSNVPIGADTPHISWPAPHYDHHVLLDLGADEFTLGRPHPMIEPEVRREPLTHFLDDDSVSVVLVDVVLGYGAHANPAQVIVDVLRERCAPAPTVIAYVCGTDADPQNKQAQSAALANAGVVLAPSNAEAARMALTYCS